MRPAPPAMRRTVPLLVLLAVPATSAQTPDPTPPWTYDPVGVGNVRAYQAVAGPVPEPLFRVDSPFAVDTLDRRWVVRRTHRYRVVGAEGNPVRWARTEDRQRVRYDTAAANVLAVGPDGGAVPLYPCRLDLPVPPKETPGSCGAGGSYSVDLDAPVTVGDTSFRAAVRSFDDRLPRSHLAAGVGLIRQGEEGSGGTGLVYAVVGGDTLGALPASFPQVSADPTPPWLYYPLAVGNEWQYEYGMDGPGGTLFPQNYGRRRVTGTREVDGRTYFVVEVAGATPDDPTWTVSTLDELVRFDTLSARVVAPDGRSLTPCPFDEPINTSGYENAVACDRGEDGGYSYLAYGSGPASDEQENGLVVTSESFKGFAYVGIADGVSPEVYAAGVGYLPNTSGAWSPLGYAALAYARVRQEDGSVLELGARVVAGEDGPEAQRFALVISPNPTTGPLAVAFDLTAPAAVTVEAFDALGRRVWRHEGLLGAGRQRLALDASAWAPGLYVVRVAAGDETATARVVRR